MVAELSGDLKVLDPVTLATVRTITRPGASTSQIGLDFLGKDLVVNSIPVPTGSLMVVNAADDPDRLYYLNPTTGAVIASVPLAGLPQVDELGVVGVAYHPTRQTLFVVRSNDLITEINPATGAAIKSFHTGFGLSQSVGDIAVQPGTGNLIVADSGRRLLMLDPETGKVLGNYDPISNSQFGTVLLYQQGVDFPGFTNDDVTGLAFDNAGKLLASTYGQRVLNLDLPGRADRHSNRRLDGRRHRRRAGRSPQAIGKQPATHPHHRHGLQPLHRDRVPARHRRWEQRLRARQCRRGVGRRHGAGNRRPR